MLLPFLCCVLAAFWLQSLQTLLGNIRVLYCKEIHIGTNRQKHECADGQKDKVIPNTHTATRTGSQSDAWKTGLISVGSHEWSLGFFQLYYG